MANLTDLIRDFRSIFEAAIVSAANADDYKALSQAAPLIEGLAAHQEVYLRGGVEKLAFPEALTSAASDLLAHGHDAIERVRLNDEAIERLELFS